MDTQHSPVSLQASSYDTAIFIGRTQELQQFDAMLRDSNKADAPWIWNLHAEGGTGKTKLLQQVANCLQERERQGASIRVTHNLVDLALSEHQTELGIFSSIARQLGDAHFTRFFEVTKKYAKTHPDMLLDEFIAGFRALAVEHIVILFDTTEVVSSSIRRYFYRILPRLKAANPALFVMAVGRPKLDQDQQDLASYPFKRITEESPDTVRSETLKALDYEESKAYLSKKIPDQVAALKPEILDKILKKTKGRPILISLVVDWARHGQPLEDLAQEENPSTFKQKLVSPLLNFANPEDSVLLLMAHLHRRFNAELLAQVFSHPITHKSCITL